MTDKQIRRPKRCIWCRYCSCYIPDNQLKRLMADDDTIRFLCPGCDDELLPPEKWVNEEE